jgi:ribonuclease P protein component
MSVPKPQRIRKAQDFQIARTQGQVVHCRAFVLQLRLCSGTLAGVRFGVIASRRVGNAVKRNLGKRRMRALFMRCQTQLPLHSDCVVILRSNFTQYTFVELEQQFLSALSRLASADKVAAPERSVDEY